MFKLSTHQQKCSEGLNRVVLLRRQQVVLLLLLRLPALTSGKKTFQTSATHTPQTQLMRVSLKLPLIYFHLVVLDKNEKTFLHTEKLRCPRQWMMAHRINVNYVSVLWETTPVQSE